MSPDWAATPTPVPYADLTNPQRFNLYSYAANNPTTRTYADGHDDYNYNQIREIEAFAERLVERALAMGGTCSGEHGVGLGKKKYLPAEHGAALDVMRTLKRALDPENRMNPGKIFDMD